MAELDASRARLDASLSVWELAYRLALHTQIGFGDHAVLLSLDPRGTVLDDDTRTVLERVEWALSDTQFVFDGSTFMLMEFTGHPLDAIPAVAHGPASGRLRWAVSRSLVGVLLTAALWLTRPRTVRVNGKEPTTKAVA
ncbi:hypothetical protein [Asanoa iriomotensis]|uniref:Uncharacterized protein n=1 Tax=Asanoa iriomotensis TaxID=234613 RepID=A0ABQ4C5D9_9ACTN|nr:hypothetical protein [Asanoa iriomotensis]GIF57626.1 hypothetical protein Air01nite_37210 [Asanoa iriomotensis]